ncbi:MAG: glycosyltransferase [Pseudomonadota bacterium]
MPCPDRGERNDWGDTYFARTLARIFREQGLAARLDFLPEWRRPAAATDDVVLVLRGLSTYEPRPGQVNLMWNISHPDKVTDEEYEAYDHVFVASASHAAALSERLDVAVSPLLQCTDATVFDQDTRTAGDERRPPIFVGNTREQYRKGVRDAIAAELDIEVYGRGWRSLIPDTLIKGDHVPNAELPTYYERAGFVINDHWPSMAEHGFLSNRLFDAGLAGATVISDEVVGLADVFDDLVPTFRSYQSLATVAKALADENEATRTERSNALQRRIRSQHTFEHRVKTIREVIDPLTAVPGLPRDAWEPPSPGRARARLLTPEQRALLRDRSLRRLTVAVIAWDVGHNPIGRAYMLAEALARHFHVVLLGPSEPRYGNGVWPPLKQSSRLSIVTFPARSTDDMMAFYQRIAPRIDADVVLACKPRLPSVSLGLQLKAATPRPLIIDVDDHELSFFPERTALPLDATDIADTELPFGQGWTRVCESLIPTGDLVLVSNPALQDKFGGTIVPHARDEDRFDPERYDRGAERQRLGLPDKARVVLFLGTPREHKGLTELLEAVLRQPEDVVLCVIGSFDNRGYRKQLEDRGGDRLFLLPDQPFEDLPHNLAVADAICLMQRTDHPISAFQLPAKLIDAIAMGIPVLVTPTPPVLSIIEAGLAIETSAETLADDLGQALAGGFRADPDRRRAFLREFSYRAINETMVPKFMALLRAEQTPPNADARAFLDRWPRAIDAPAGAADGLHLVFLWKQNDSGLYGRRVDMLARYALADPRVASVAMVDAPVSINQVRAWESKGPSSQFGHVAELLWRKRWGLMDADRMSWHSFVYEDAAQRHPDAVRGYATADAFPGWLREELQRTGRDPAQTVFVTFPVGEHMLPAIEACGPRAVIADVVDDQRTWPGLDEAQVNAIAAQYATILERANAVMTNCEPVQASMREFVSDIALIPNAAEPTRTNGDLDGPPELAGVNGPVVGYVGNFEPAKFDEGLVRRLAEAHADWQFVLIGSTHMNPDLINRMGDLANILFPGVIPYDELPAWVAQLDCAIIPHLDTEQTRSMNPLKSYVYAAAGVPIVSTAVANLAALDDDHLTIAKDAEAFARAVAERIARGREARFEVPADQCWPERVSRMLGLIDDALATSAREAS